MTWSSMRQTVYGISFTLIVLAIIGIPSYFIFFNKPASCFDNKQNQNELGIDCGGICNRACSQQVLAEPVLMWSRVFNVSGGVYNLTAYLQNANVSYISEPAEYLFKVYDAENILIGTRYGKVAVPPVKTFPIFEQNFDAGQRVPVKVTFEFTKPIIWNKSPSTYPEFSIIETVLKNATTSPRIDAKIVNNTLNRYADIEVVAVVYGVDENAIGVSRTIVPTLLSRGSANIVYTWPQPFTQTVSKIEIIPKLPN